MTGDNYVLLPSGVLAFGEGMQEKNIHERVKRWHGNITNVAFFLILAGSQTAEIEGISSAGSTPISRRYTAIADAELLLRGPLNPKRWPLPPLPAGVSPALISYVASRFLKIKPTIILKVLVLPAPFGPKRPTISPGLTFIVTFFTIFLLDKVKSKLSISRVISKDPIRGNFIHKNYSIINDTYHI